MSTEPAADLHDGASGRAARSRALRIRYAILGAVLAGLWVGHSGEPAWEHALRTRPWGQYAVTEEFIAEQQHAADLFHANGLIEQDIRVSDAVLPEINALVTAGRPAD